MAQDWPLLLVLALAGLATVAGLVMTLYGVWQARRSRLPQPK
jgi:hypothetical protein